jgi:uncharacterized surface protein with fasciclin (FAS1) repeats
MKIKNQILKTILVAFVAIMTFSCTSTDDNKEVVVPKKSILDIVKADPDFSILVAALKKTGLEAPGTSPLGSAGSYTVFAPTNAAFIKAKFTLDAINALNAVTDKATIDNLRKMLQNHILGVGTLANDLLAAGYVKTFATGPNTGTNLSMFINKPNEEVLINGGIANGGAKVTSADIVASNGIIHVIDGVLVLPTLVSQVKANPIFSTLATVVTSGPAIPATTTPPSPAIPAGPYGDQSAIMDVLTKATSNSVYDGLKNPNASLTVFAPTNDAFTAALKGFLTGTNATPASISKILQYHFSRSIASANPATTPAIPGNLLASSATSWASSNATINTLAPNVTGPNQTFLIAQGTVKITELPAQTGVPASNIKLVNIQATNGVIHAIDRVLQPTGL